MARIWGPAPNTARAENRRLRRNGFGLANESDRDRYPSRCRRFGHDIYRKEGRWHCYHCPKTWPLPAEEAAEDQQEGEHSEHGERSSYGDRKGHGER